MNQKGLTLTELLVSTVLIGFVMMGVGGFNQAVTSIENTTSKASIVEMKSAHTMAQIRRDVEKAVGDRINHGIRETIVYDGLGNYAEGFLCIRQDNNNPQTPGDDRYLDDDWICYLHENDFILRRCVNGQYWQSPAGGYHTGGLPHERRDNVCSTVAECCNAADSQTIITTLEPDLITPFFTINYDAANEGIISVTLDIRHTSDDNLATGDELVQPSNQLQTQVTPIGHSR